MAQSESPCPPSSAFLEHAFKPDHVRLKECVFRNEFFRNCGDEVDGGLGIGAACPSLVPRVRLGRTIVFLFTLLTMFASDENILYLKNLNP